ncbi:MAG: U32 family peptidase [Gammaproteobacteria bacterium]|nr:U32 family peptidase [Gammaproteobacteria bacterium]
MPAGPGLTLTLAPIPFHWEAARKRDFYARIAEEAPVDTVCIGETICSKRAPFFEPFYEEAAERLRRGGKQVVFSSLGEVMLKRERDMTADLAALAGDGIEIEINDASALLAVKGRPHRIGALMNVYNEATLGYLAGRGATHFALLPELPRERVALLAAHARGLGVGIEVQAFGRASLALSARCYHARAHHRVKDNCQFVCEEDADGMELRTLEGVPFLAVNGIQTLSYGYVCLLGELAEIARAGVSGLRLVPHSLDMVAVAAIFREALDGRIEATEGEARLKALGLAAPLVNGFWHGKAGSQRITPAGARVA